MWLIFNLDIEFGKFIAQKKQVEDFLKNISEMLLGKENEEAHNELEYHIRKVHFAKSQRELRDYESLIDFYKAYF